MNLASIHDNIRPEACECCGAHERCGPLRIRHCSDTIELGQQSSVAIGVGGAGPARRAHPRRTAECVNAKPGIVAMEGSVHYSGRTRAP